MSEVKASVLACKKNKTSEFCWNPKAGAFVLRRSEDATPNGGLYVDLKTQDLVAGYVKYYSTGTYSNLHISPKYTNGSLIDFRAIAGHELIHAYHYATFGANYVRASSETVAYFYTAKTYLLNGNSNLFWNNMSYAISRGYTYAPSNYYSLPFSWK